MVASLHFVNFSFLSHWLVRPLAEAMAGRYKKFCGQILPLCSKVCFTLVSNTRIKILNIYSSYLNEGKNYSRSTFKVVVICGRSCYSSLWRLACRLYYLVFRLRQGNIAYTLLTAGIFIKG